MSSTATIRADVLDPEDGEAGIVEVYSGRVLARFRSIESARSALKRDYQNYLARASLSQTGEAQ